MDWTKPTTQMLGRFQPWHQGHTELFKRCLAKTGQVAILLRESDGTDKNPYDQEEREEEIYKVLVEDNEIGEKDVQNPVGARGAPTPPKAGCGFCSSFC